MTPLVKGIISCVCCVVIILCCLCCIWSGIQAKLDADSKDGTLKYATPPVLGKCPAEWKYTTFTNGDYCIQNGAIAITNNKGELIKAGPGEKCPFSIVKINGNDYCVDPKA